MTFLHAVLFRVRVCLLAIFSALSLAQASPAWADTTDLESPVCGDDELRQASAFRDAAERNGRKTVNAADVKPMSIEVNGTALSGFKLEAASNSGDRRRSNGALLVLQGNAMLAEQIVELFRSYALAGFDVYIIDYRGFGNSAGRPYLKAIIADVTEIARRLAQETQGHLFLYGMSFGAGVALKVIDSGVAYRAAVIDAAPSRFLKLKLLCIFPVELMKCDDEYNPVNNVPEDATKLLFLHGSKDRVIRTCDAAELRTVAKNRKGEYRELDGFSHPLTDSQDNYRRRNGIILEFLLAHL